MNPQMSPSHSERGRRCAGAGQGPGSGSAKRPRFRWNLGPAKRSAKRNGRILVAPVVSARPFIPRTGAPGSGPGRKACKLSAMKKGRTACRETRPVHRPRFPQPIKFLWKTRRTVPAYNKQRPAVLRQTSVFIFPQGRSIPALNGGLGDWSPRLAPFPRAYFTTVTSYSRVPRPIFSAWARPAFHSTSGVVLVK